MSFVYLSHETSVEILIKSIKALILTGDEAAKRKEVLDWIEGTIQTKDSAFKLDKLPFEKVLKDGVILCKLMNVLIPDSIKKVNTTGSSFKLMENHAAVQKAMKKYGVPQEEIFQTVDLFEARNLKQVSLSLYALGRLATNKGFAGPGLGPKMSDENKREFTEEQIRQGRDAQIGLQAGSNKGASQAGISMGKQRMVID